MDVKISKEVVKKINSIERSAIKVLESEFEYNFDSGSITGENPDDYKDAIQATKIAICNRLRIMKTHHELPNQNNHDFNQGYVKAMNDVLNMIR